uniref:Translation initiation factor beta propellor-like domain-containing protein n=1 Tax=Hucho hucho TaxID=62062 RepID=A0A4W5MJB6_9TELE
MFDKQQANSIFWSPQGQFMVLAGLRSMNGALAFVDTSDCTMMNMVEHYMASDVEWDPTGRYLVTSVSWWSHKVDNAYWLWTFQGRLLQKNNKDRFCQLLWRPRPATLLTQDAIKVRTGVCGPCIDKGYLLWHQNCFNLSGSGGSLATLPGEMQDKIPKFNY